MKSAIKLLFFLFSIPIFSNAQNTTNIPAKIVANEYPDQKSQIIEEWESSHCYWAGQVRNWEESKINSLIKLV